MEKESVILREMLPGEADALYKTAMKAFSPLEAMGASKPKQAIVATVDGNVAAGMFLKTFTGTGGRKTGYLDLGFTVRQYRGKGLGNKVYAAAIEKLKKDGCDKITAMVKDDNVASWGLLERNGFSSVGFLRFFGTFGFGMGLVLWLRTFFCIACGMDFWVSDEPEKRGPAAEFAGFFALNLALILIHSLISGGGAFSADALISAVTVLAVSTAGGALGCLPNKYNWKFGFPRGGLLISGPLMIIGTFFPLNGRWYPVRRENSAEQKRALGLQSLIEWAVLLALYAAAVWLIPGDGLFRYVAQYASIVLVFRIIAIFPFEYFGGTRIFVWSKPWFIIMAALTVVLLFVVP